MCLQNSIDEGFAGYLDVISSLQEVNTIVLRTKTFILSGDTLIDLVDQYVCCFWILDSDSKVVHLMTYK